MLLAGVIDTFNGHYQLSDAQLTRALAESEKAVNDARNQAAKVQTSKGEAFVTEFKRKRARRSRLPVSGIASIMRVMKPLRKTRGWTSW
ncbi:FKBP-type peptidyl-prolyl cis-trans isomerase N-terminal domain-containing protein [Serratia ureilytica]